MQCSENQCSPYIFHKTHRAATRVLIDGVPNSPCVANERLSTHTKTYCSVQCKVGSSSTDEETTGDVYCPIGSVDGATPITTFNCAENECSALKLPTHAIGSDTPGVPPCEQGSVLSTITKSFCGLSCAPGYRGETAQAVCNINAMNGVTPPDLSAFKCDENKCAPLVFPVGAVRAEDGTDDIPTCKRGGLLGSQTKNKCAVKCGTGYSDNQKMVECLPDSSDGAAALIDLNCFVSVVRISLECAGDSGCIYGDDHQRRRTPELDQEGARNPPHLVARVHYAIVT